MMNPVIKIFILLLLTLATNRFVYADEVIITTEFTPSAVNPGNNEFVNTTPISGFCQTNANTAYCRAGNVTIATNLSARNRVLNFNSTSLRDQLYQRIDNGWRIVTLYDRGSRKQITATFRITAVFTRFVTRTGWDKDKFSVGGLSPVGGCERATSLSSSTVYDFGWIHPGPGLECYKKVPDVNVNDITISPISIGYELRSLSPMSLPNGNYEGSISYFVGNNNAIDLGNATYSDDELKITIRTTIKHDFKVEHTSSQKVMLEPQGGWDTVIGSGSNEVPLRAQSTFALTASAPFSLYLECEHNQLGNCALQKEGSDETVPVIISVTMPQMRNIITGESVTDMVLPMRQNHMPSFNLEPTQFNNAASSTVQFKINGPDSRKMITQPGTTWKGAVTLVFDADLPFASQ
ncbi:hypothetical protein I4B01_002720 [Enterobacter kobei]|uniref:hypothetical protein n=1 Tax=Enterobacter TaxID=547 RepID=UPI001BD63D51|nr:hypothetical protein [Enterobacter kobei]EHN8793094.1 hypothetical protein [Enterobacter kobei]